MSSGHNELWQPKAVQFGHKMTNLSTLAVDTFACNLRAYVHDCIPYMRIHAMHCVQDKPATLTGEFFAFFPVANGKGWSDVIVKRGGLTKPKIFKYQLSWFLLGF